MNNPVIQKHIISSNQNIFYNSPTVLDSNTNINEKNTKKNQNQINSSDILGTLQTYLEGDKQIGNYIKCRKNTEILIDLLKKLPKEKTDE
jgi:hypothetical protein